jgi:hypothetical protein
MNATRSDFQLVPNYPGGENPTKQAPKMVTTYFIGYKVLRAVMEKKEVVAKDGRVFHIPTEKQIGWAPPLFLVGGRPFQMPAIGESIVVPANVFEQLKERSRWPENNMLFEGVTDDPHLASAIRQAWEACGKDPSKMGDMAMNKITVTASVSNLSDDALIQELERRALLRQGESPAESLEESTDEEVDKKGKD